MNVDAERAQKILNLPTTGALTALPDPLPDILYSLWLTHSANLVCVCKCVLTDRFNVFPRGMVYRSTGRYCFELEPASMCRPPDIQEVDLLFTNFFHAYAFFTRLKALGLRPSTLNEGAFK